MNMETYAEIEAQISIASKERLLKLASYLERRADMVPLYRDGGGIERRAMLLDLADKARTEATNR